MQLSKADVQRNVSRFVTFLVARQCLDLRGLVEEVFVSGLQHARVKGTSEVHVQCCYLHLSKSLISTCSPI